MQNKLTSTSFVFRRLAAFLYDSLLLIAIFFVVTTVAIAINDGQAVENHAFKVVLYGFGFLFFSWFWRNGGQTLGMQAWRIKVINDSQKTDDTFERLTYKQCAIRYLIGTILFGITLLIALIRPSGQGLHDSASNTKIVFKNKELKSIN